MSPLTHSRCLFVCLSVGLSLSLSLYSTDKHITRGRGVDVVDLEVVRVDVVDLEVVRVVVAALVCWDT